MPRKKPQQDQVNLVAIVSISTRSEIKAEAALNQLTVGQVIEKLWQGSGKAGKARAGSAHG